MSESPDKSTVKQSGSAKRAILPDPLLGMILADRYEITELIGTGGFGSVYKAKHLSLNMDVAVKVLHRQHLIDDVNLKRFEQEARLLSRIENQHVVKVIDFGLEPAPFIVMEFFSGESLSKWLKANGAVPAAMGIDLFLQLCDALSCAESMHIVHRDLKPSNILLKFHEHELQCKILDFGVAKIVDLATSDEKLTATGEVVGSPAYMAPEQWKGEGDNRADIYSLGCIMYEVLGAKPAFSAKFGMEYMNKHVTETPQSLTKYNEELKVPEELERIVFRCLQKAPENRYQSINQCISDLKRLKDGMKLAVALPEQERVQRKKLAKLGILLASLVGLLAVIVYNDAIFRSILRSVPELDRSTQSKIPIEPMPIHIGLPNMRPEKYQDKNLSQWTQLIEDNPLDGHNYFCRGMLHFYRREYSEANRDFDKTTELDKSFADVYVERSILRTASSQNGEYDKTLADANMAIKLSPKSPRGYFARAYVYETSEQNELAIADGEKALELGELGSEYEPAYLNNFENLSTAYMNMGRYDDADKTIELGLKKVSPRFKWLMYRQKSLLHCFKQDFAKALEAVELAIKQEDCGPSGLMMKAFCLASMGKIEEAQKVALSSESKQTGPPEAYRGRGEFWRLCGLPEQAIQDFGKAIWLEQSKNYHSYRLRANCYLEQGNLHDALSDIQEAVSMNPRSARCRGMLAMIESRLGKTTRAQKHIKEAFEMPTHAPALFMYRASIEYDSGKINEALQDLNEAIKRDPYFKEAYALRQFVNGKLGRVEEAQNDLYFSKKLAPHPQMLP